MRIKGSGQIFNSAKSFLLYFIQNLAVHRVQPELF